MSELVIIKVTHFLLHHFSTELIPIPVTLNTFHETLHTCTLEAQ